MLSQPFKTEITVPEGAIDSLGHVNNVTYLQWVQDIAEKHWKSKAPETIRREVYWVVLNHFIAYKKPAYAGDRLILKTWVERLNGVKSERHTEILRQHDQSLLTQAKTVWCLMDAESHRPKRITSTIKDIFE